jgi:transcriptional regulator with XRE-family HTH domain
MNTNVMDTTDPWHRITEQHAHERREFGRHFRELRKKAGLTGSALAEATGMSQPKISKIETGRQLPSTGDVEALAAPLRLGTKQRQSLLQEAERLRASFASWRISEQSLGEEQRIFGALEHEAKLITDVQAVVVPGLLQTADYAREIFSRVTFSDDEDIGAAVTERMGRQRILTSADRIFQFIVLEAALRTRYGSPQLMLSQLRHIQLIASWENVELAIVPFAAVLPVVVQHGFTVFDDRFVSADTTSGALRIHKGSEVKDYADAATALRSVAATDDAAQALLAAIADTYS